MDEAEILDQQLEDENEAAIQAAENEEENYLKEIAREQSEEVETEPETEGDSDLGASGNLESPVQLAALDFDAMVVQLERESEHYLLQRNHVSSCVGVAGEKEQRNMTSWCERGEEEEVSTRTPGRSVRVHEKLSSPSRKR